jgi:parvulin-like peptidyl-prolyl isomerase
MADDKENVQTDESSIERINDFVTSSDPVKDVPEEKVEVVDEIVDEKENSEIEKPKPIKKQEVKKVVVKKPVPKKVFKPVVQPKVVKVVKTQPKVVKTEPKSVPKPKIKKHFIIKKSAYAPKKIGDDNMSKKHKSKNDNKNTNKLWLWIGIGVLVLILVAALVFVLLNKAKPPVVPVNETAKDVAATVNGEPVYLQDVIRDYNNMNPMIQSLYSVPLLVNKTIDELLLMQHAKALGLSIPKEEVQVEIDNIKAQNKMTDADLQTALTQQGMTLESLRAVIEKNLLIRELLNKTVISNITVKNSDVERYYNLNIEKFKVPSKVTVEHILIAISENVTENQSKEKIEQVNKELTSTNFCDLVTKYTDDTGSKDTCGKYTFAKGEFNNPEFEDPSFDLNIGETTIVKTVFGYHLIKKLENIPGRTLNLTEVYDQVNLTVYNDLAQKAFDALVADLRSKAIIVNYVEKTNTNETTLTTLPKSLDKFAQCLTDKGAKFYGASWCPHCENQKAMFGESLAYVTYVECAEKDNPQVQTKECTDAGITGYPTWTIGSKSYPGEQTIDTLARLTGCVKP